MEFNLEQTIKFLENTPSVIESLINPLNKEWYHLNEGENSWSPYDVLGHLVHGEKTDWLPRIMIMLNEGNQKTFAPYDRFAQFEMNKGKSMEQLLDEFKSSRAENINRLKELELMPFDLEKKAIHPSLGTVSMKNLLSAWMVHDFGHIAQISRVVAKQYKDHIGPWTKYLTIVNFTPSE